MTLAGSNAAPPLPDGVYDAEATKSTVEVDAPELADGTLTAALTVATWKMRPLNGNAGLVAIAHVVTPWPKLARGVALSTRSSHALRHPALVTTAAISSAVSPCTILSPRYTGNVSLTRGRTFLRTTVPPRSLTMAHPGAGSVSSGPCSAWNVCSQASASRAHAGGSSGALGVTAKSTAATCSDAVAFAEASLEARAPASSLVFTSPACAPSTEPALVAAAASLSAVAAAPSFAAPDPLASFPAACASPGTLGCTPPAERGPSVSY